MNGSIVIPAADGRERFPGMAAMVGGGAYVVAGLIMGFTGEDYRDPVVNALSFVWTLGALSGLAGIARLGVAGRGRLGPLALGLTLLAYAMLAADFLLITVGVYVIDDSPLIGLILLGTVIGMMLIGIATVRAGRWRDWRRLSPFLLLLVIPLRILSAQVLGIDAPGVLPGLFWIAIGYAIWSTPAYFGATLSGTV